VLFLFSSRALEGWLLAHGLPAIPLVPVSSSQAIIGGIVGIAIVRRGREIRYKVLGDIALGWLVTPILAGLITFFGLFVLQNVFSLEVYRKATPAAAQLSVQPRIDVGGLANPNIPGDRVRKATVKPTQPSKPATAPAASSKNAEKEE
jgi:PiT family inorganic phosphate transporter